MSTTTITVHITIIFTKWSFRKRPIRISFTCSHAAICQCWLFHVLSLARSGCGCWLFIVYHFMLFCRPDTQNNLLFLNAKPNVNSTENCLCTSGGFRYGKMFAFWQHSNSNFVTHHLWVLPLYDVLHRSNIVTVCCWLVTHTGSNTSETEALGLDYCITTPEVQLIQSQPVHNEHMLLLLLLLLQQQQQQQQQMSWIWVLPCQSHCYGGTLQKSSFKTVAQLNADVCRLSEYDWQKRWDLVSLRNVKSEEQARVSSGRLFHARAAATGKAQSPRVARRLRLSSMCRWCVSPAMCRCDNTGLYRLAALSMNDLSTPN